MSFWGKFCFRIRSCQQFLLQTSITHLQSHVVTERIFTSVLHMRTSKTMNGYSRVDEAKTRHCTGSSLASLITTQNVTAQSTTSNLTWFQTTKQSVTYLRLTYVMSLLLKIYTPLELKGNISSLLPCQWTQLYITNCITIHTCLLGKFDLPSQRSRGEAKIKRFWYYKTNVKSYWKG